jgi:hypothetical protein
MTLEIGGVNEFIYHPYYSIEQLPKDSVGASGRQPRPFLRSAQQPIYFQPGPGSPSAESPTRPDHQGTTLSHSQGGH